MTMRRNHSIRLALCLLALVPLSAPGLRAGNPPSISGTLTDAHDGLIPLGGPAVFEFEDLQYTFGDATGEYPEGQWTIEWSLDQQTWMTPLTHPDHFEEVPNPLRFLPRAAR